MDDKKITLNKNTVKKLVRNSTLLSRHNLAKALGQSFSGERDYYSVFGYNETLTFSDYDAKYQRQDISGRIVDAPADETWRERPEIIETRDESGDETAEDDYTQFEQDWQELLDRLKVFHYMKRADRLAGIGEFGIFVIGVKDKSPLEEEMPNLSGPDDVIYLSPFAQGRVDIETWNTDPFSPRYRLPEIYEVDFEGNVIGDSKETTPTLVHHSRVIHIAENLGEDEVYGRPRLKRVFNLLDDLYKVAGGAPELFWQNARGGIQLDVRDDFDPELLEESDLEDRADEYFNGLRRMLKTAGVDLRKLANDVADPEPTFKIIIQLISAATGIPVRVLLGSERGELASSQDEKNWLSQIQTRQTNFAESVILRPFIDRLIEYGALPDVEYEVRWPDLFKLDDAEKAKMYLDKAKAANEFAVGASSSIVDIEKVLRDELELPILETEEVEIDENDDNVKEYFDNLKEG